MNGKIKTDVIIIGAGPTGLSLACQLVRYGIDFILIEKNATVTSHSKAIGVQARTLEIYEQLGLAQQAVSHGQIARKICLLTGGKIRAEINLSNMGLGLSPYPYLLFLEQSKNEQLLYEYLLNHQKNVLWNTELDNFTQTEIAVTAQVKTLDGDFQVIEAQYLVGCDGAKSLVRNKLGLSFEGSTLERLFYVADVQIDWPFSHDAGYACLAPASTALFFPMEGEKQYRIIGTFPEGLDKDEGEFLYEEIEQRIQHDTKLALDISKVNWFSVYKVHSRGVNKFSEGRCFVAGDAAHIHSPAGAQGMNTGIQDAYNLAWKIAFVIKGYADEKLLETYNEERLPNSKKLLQTTDRAFAVLIGSNRVIGLLRMTIFPTLLRYLFKLNVIGKLAFLFISQTRIHYRNASLSMRNDNKIFKVKAGDRMPYFLIDGERVYNRLHQPKFHFLVFSNLPTHFKMLEMELAHQYREFFDCSEILLDSKVTEVFGMNTSFVVLLRPDNHIAFISTEISLNELSVYMDRFFCNSKLQVT
ncbi:MAG: FAD-dependent monooxygenase [Methylotenera sp.]